MNPIIFTTFSPGVELDAAATAAVSRLDRKLGELLLRGHLSHRGGGLHEATVRDGLRLSRVSAERPEEALGHALGMAVQKRHAAELAVGRAS